MMQVFHKIFDRSIDLENIFFSWDEFRKGKAKKSDIQLFERHLEDNIFALAEELAAGTYQHGSYFNFRIRDPKPRLISKALVRDRLVQHLVFRELYRIFDSTFIYHSYSSRLSKGTHLAVHNLSVAARRLSRNYTRPIFALKCDIKKFFGSIPHQKLLTMIQNKIKDTQFVWLVKEIVESFNSNSNNSLETVEGGGGELKEKNLKFGLPIGNITSQIFANIYLNELDQFVTQQLKIKYYFRYADDFVILHRSPHYLEEQLLSIVNFLKNQLSLKLHPDKVEIRKLPRGIDFLGYVILPHRIVLRTKTKRRMFKKLKEKLKLLDEDLISRESYFQSLQSYLGTLKHCQAHNLQTLVKNSFGRLCG